MTDISTRSQTNDAHKNFYDAFANIIASLVGAIKDLPLWQRIAGFVLVVGLVPITMVIYSVSSERNKLWVLVISLIWFLIPLFVAYAFSENQRKLKDKLKSFSFQNTELEELRASLLNAATDKHQSLLEIESRLEKISTQIGELLRDHPGLTSSITKVKNSVDTLSEYIKENEESYDDFLRLMDGTESMRQSKSVGASILASESSQKSLNQP
jgi:Na+/phosphate symporter